MSTTAERFREQVTGQTVFRSPDETEEIALMNDGRIMKRKTGTRTWKRYAAGRVWDRVGGSTVKRLRRNGWTEHKLDEEGDTIG